MDRGKIDRALIRAIRVIAYGALAGGLTAAIGQVKNVDDPAVAMLLTAVLSGIDKFLRDKGTFGATL